MARVVSRSLTSPPATGAAARDAQRSVERVAQQFAAANNAIAAHATTVANNRRDLINSIRDDSLAESVGGRRPARP